MPSFSFLYVGAPRSAPLSTLPKPLKLSPPNALYTPSSTTPVPTMSTISSPPNQPNGRSRPDSTFINTIPDPRAPSPSAHARSASSDSHPDLSNEVSMLSTKLINAINHSTNLDDALQHARHELDATRQRLAHLEAQDKSHAAMITSGVLLKKAQVDANMDKLRAELADARQERETSDKARKEMEVELETLTSALFEEANTMVADARREGESSEKRNAQLRTQLNDTELLLASQQEQLQDLKGVMERMSSERDETETNAHSFTAPSTPGLDTANKMSRMLDSLPLSPALNVEIPPDQPLRFSYLLTPVLRSDLPAYSDFVDLLKSSRPLSSHSRSPSGAATASAKSSYLPSSMSSSTPNLPGSFASSSVTSSPRESSVSIAPPLKDNKFYKRCLSEDIEPTLRLDLAPGLSWLARRTVISAVTAGSLVVEPFVPQSRFYGPVHACALCGESRRTDTHARRHRFRTSEDDAAQRYPLCEYCLGRIRATGDYMGFLRMVRDGLWRATTDEDFKTAWEESVRLREKMFWARLGGGVVPTGVRGESPMTGHQKGESGLSRMDSSTSSMPRDSREVSRASEDSEGLAQTLDIPKRTEDPFRSSKHEKRVSIGTTTIERLAAADGLTVQDFGAATEPPSETIAEDRPAQSAAQPAEEAVNDEQEEDKHLSVTIPGSFE